MNSDLLDLRTFFYPLNVTVWSCILASTLMIVIGRLLVNGNEKDSILEVIWESFATYFGGNFDRGTSGRKAYSIIMFVALFCGNIVWMGYQASLTVDLSSPTIKLPFLDMQTFLGSGWKLYTFKKGYLKILVRFFSVLIIFCDSYIPTISEIQKLILLDLLKREVY